MATNPTDSSRKATWTQALCVLFAVILCVPFSGCTSASSPARSSRLGPVFSPKNFTAVAEIPAGVRRVAVLPAAGLEGFPHEFGAEQEAMIAASLGATRRFEVVVVDRDRMTGLTGFPVLNSAAEWPAGSMERIAKETAADAVLFTDFTVFRPYSPVAIGVRSRLVRIADGDTVLWAFDEVFDSAEASVARAAWRHAGGGSSRRLVEATVLQSPSRFAAYVWDAAFQTLPARFISR